MHEPMHGGEIVTDQLDSIAMLEHACMEPQGKATQDLSSQIAGGSAARRRREADLPGQHEGKAS